MSAMQGQVKAARLSSVLNAALGYVADSTDGFIDFDAVPADGASVKVGAMYRAHHGLSGPWYGFQSGRQKRDLCTRQ